MVKSGMVRLRKVMWGEEEGGIICLQFEFSDGEVYPKLGTYEGEEELNECEFERDVGEVEVAIRQQNNTKQISRITIKDKQNYVMWEWQGPLPQTNLGVVRLAEHEKLIGVNIQTADNVCVSLGFVIFDSQKFENLRENGHSEFMTQKDRFYFNQFFPIR